MTASQHAKMIIGEIDRHAESFLMGYPIDQTIMSATRGLVYAHLRRMGRRGTITMTYKNGMLYVGTKQAKSRVELLEDMVRKLMASTENESLYEQAHNLLHGG